MTCTCSICRREDYQFRGFVIEYEGGETFLARFDQLGVYAGILVSKVSEQDRPLIVPGARLEMQGKRIVFCRATWTQEEIDEAKKAAEQYAEFFRSADQSS